MTEFAELVGQSKDKKKRNFSSHGTSRKYGFVGRSVENVTQVRRLAGSYLYPAVTLAVLNRVLGTCDSCGTYRSAASKGIPSGMCPKSVDLPAPICIPPWPWRCRSRFWSSLSGLRFLRLVLRAFYATHPEATFVTSRRAAFGGT